MNSGFRGHSGVFWWINTSNSMYRIHWTAALMTDYHEQQHRRQTRVLLWLNISNSIEGEHWTATQMIDYHEQQLQMTLRGILMAEYIKQHLLYKYTEQQPWWLINMIWTLNSKGHSGVLRWLDISNSIYRVHWTATLLTDYHMRKPECPPELLFGVYHTINAILPPEHPRMSSIANVHGSQSPRLLFSGLYRSCLRYSATQAP